MDLENYRFHDAEFTLHINLLVVALRYWRRIRKEEELEVDRDGEKGEKHHFLDFNQKEFDSNFDYLEQYSLATPTFRQDNLE